MKIFLEIFIALTLVAGLVFAYLSIFTCDGSPAEKYFGAAVLSFICFIFAMNCYSDSGSSYNDP